MFAAGIPADLIKADTKKKAEPKGCVRAQPQEPLVACALQLSVCRSPPLRRQHYSSASRGFLAPLCPRERAQLRARGARRGARVTPALTRSRCRSPHRPLILRKTFFGMELPLGNPLMAIMFLGCYALGAYGTGLPEGKILGNQPRYALVGD